MAFRSDITVDWTQSPRIITVAAPSTEVTIQDMYDTLRILEERPGEGLPYPYIVDTAGKQNLGGGVLVGLTMTLRNARLAFQGRKASVVEGSTITTTDATGVTLTDSTATFITDGVEPGAWVINLTDGSRATVLRVVSETVITTDGLGDGVDNQFGLGDSYEIQNVTQCNVSGGNLVAIDENGADLAPILPTVGTQIIQANSSSATLQELTEIQYAAFNHRVAVDESSTYSGTTYPVGTDRAPVNNFTDALAIATARGFDTFHLIGAVTLQTFDFTGISFVGDSPNETVVTVDSTANVANTSFTGVTLQGALDGSSFISECIVGNVTGVKGFIRDSVLNGTITMNSNQSVPLFIFDCSDGIPGPSTPVVDFNGVGAALNCRGYRGGITLQNKSGSDEVSIDGNVRVVLNNTITAGSFIIRGVGKVTDNSTGTTSVDATQLLSNTTVADYVWDETASEHVAAGTMGELQNAGGSLTPTQATMLLEMYRLLGLDPTKPLVVDTPPSGVGTRKVPADGSDINQSVVKVGDTTTVTRV